MAKRRKKRSVKSLIKNYGLMWRRNSVFWGHGGKRGSLIGRRSRQQIDFRDQIGVYVLYDEGRRPTYVGQAGRGKARLFNRLSGHTRDSLSLRWQYFSWFGLLGVNKSGQLSGWDDESKHVGGTIGSTLDEIEGVLIAATEPPFNKQGAKFRGARYRQVPDPAAGDVSNAELRDLLNTIMRKLGC
jgi:hypothetical protein